MIKNYILCASFLIILSHKIKYKRLENVCNRKIVHKS